MIRGFPVTDLHLHVHPASMQREAAHAVMEGTEHHALAESPSALLAALDRWGIERAGIVNYVAPEVMGYPPEINDWAARFCAAAPDRLIAFGSVHPRVTKDAREEAERVLDLGARILKIHPPHQHLRANDYDSGLGEVYAVAQERGVPVMVHTGTSVFPGARNVFADPMPCDDVAVDFPDLKLILAHVGRPLDVETAVFLARRHANVWLEISGIPPRRLLEWIPRLPDLAPKTLWGTDWPGPGVRDPRGNVEAFLDLPLADEVKRAVLDGNSRRLFP